MRRGVRSFMHRTPAEQAATPCRRRNKAALLCVLQALLLLLAALPLPRCNGNGNGNATATATKSNSSNVATRTGAAKANAADQNLIILKRCYPDVFLLITDVTYFCVVDDATALIGLELYAAQYYDRAGKFYFALRATLEDSNIVSFLADTDVIPGLLDFCIARYFWIQSPMLLPMTTNLTMEFLDLDDTAVTFSLLDPYYGMAVNISTNFKRENLDHYLLIDHHMKCQYFGANCSADEGCYKAVAYETMPPPGNYRLCLTAKHWNGQYLPWGTSLLEVRAMVATLLYLMRGSDTVVALEDAATGTPVLQMNGTFLAPCAGKSCSHVTLKEIGEVAVHVDACVGPPVSQRVYLSAGGALNASEGVYAVCASRGPDGGISPAALPVVVLEKPFTFNAVADTTMSVRVHVSGGDLAWREEPYIMCAVPSDESCESAVAGAHLCVTSASAREPSVMMDLTDTGLTMDNARFCLVAVNVTFLGRTHTWAAVAGATNETSTNAVVTPRSGLAAGAIVGIVLAVVVVVAAAALLAVCVLQRRQQGRNEFAEDAEDPSQPACEATTEASPEAVPSPAEAGAIDASGSLSTSEVFSTVSSGDSMASVSRQLTYIGTLLVGLSVTTGFRFITFLAMAGEFVIVRRLVRYMETEVPRTGADPALVVITPDGTRTSAPFGGDYLFKTLPGVDLPRSKVFVDASGHTCLAFGAGAEPVARGRWLFITLWTKYGPDVPTRNTVDLMREVVLPPDFVPSSHSTEFLNRLMLEKDVFTPHLMESSLFPAGICTVLLGTVASGDGAAQQEAFSTRSAPKDSWSVENLEERYITNPLNPMGFGIGTQAFTNPIPTRRKGGRR